MRSLLCPYSEQVTDRVTQFGPVQGVKVEVADAASVELPAELRCDRRRNQLARPGQVVEALKETIQPLWNTRAAALGEAPCLGDVRDRQDPRYDLDINACRSDLVLKS